MRSRIDLAGHTRGSCDAVRRRLCQRGEEVVCKVPTCRVRPPIAEQAVGRAAMCSRACIAHSWRSASQFSSSDPERILGQPALSRRGSFSSCSRDTIWQSSSSEQKPSAPVEPSPWLGLSSIFFIVYPVDSMPAERLSGRN